MIEKTGETTNKGKKKILTELAPLFWIIAFVLVTFLGYKIYAEFRPGTASTKDLVQNQGPALGIDGEGDIGLEIGKLAPDFTSKDVNQKTISLSDFRGEKPVLLVFWATWCGFCTKELPDLVAFTQEHQDEIQVIAVGSGESRETIRNYIQEKNVNFLMLLDEARTIWNKYLVRGTPSHFLISSQGRIVDLRPGLVSREELELMMAGLTEL